jgi:hypothetical protein
MKQLLSLFLFLLPCLAWAQYPSNGNQKITLGEQTTADGLIWRGVAADTTLTAKSDTAAYFVLDTVNINLYTYKASATGRKWIQLGSDTTSLNLVSRFAVKLNISDTASMLTNYYRSGRTGIIQASDVPTLNQNTTGSAATLTTSRTFQTNLASTSTASFNGSANVTPGVTGTLPVANGGTNTSTAFTAGSVVFAGASGTYTQDNSGIFFDNTNNRLGINTASPLGLLEARSTVGGTNNGLFSLYENSGTSPYFLFRKARGTPASPSAVQLNDGTGELSFQGYHPDGFDNAVVLRAFNYLAPGASYLNGGFKILINSQAGGGLAERVSIISNGNFGINISVPTEKLHVSGNARIDGLANAANPVNVQVDVNGVLVRTSSIELKEHIESLPYGLNEILLLQPSKFNYKDKYKYGEGYDIGFIAEDVNNVIPEAVGTGVESDIFMDSVKLIPVLVKAIQEQQALIKTLEQRIINLENK